MISFLCAPDSQKKVKRTSGKIARVVFRIAEVADYQPLLSFFMLQNSSFRLDFAGQPRG